MPGPLRGALSAVVMATSAAVSAGWPASASAQNPPITINVDVNANRRAINPDIYGVAHATAVQVSGTRSAGAQPMLTVPTNRLGGQARRRP